ncbi:MAG: M28 family peptidase [Cyanobacteria bacterium NC_groundwater_1444_Ag_S-0.65um_54_12]|nr:M28 family peptidase [Cyanobacteria bacterium NC_groundwater_1444_Ag_S-0.65um_54_12]
MKTMQLVSSATRGIVARYQQWLGGTLLAVLLNGMTMAPAPQTVAPVPAQAWRTKVQSASLAPHRLRRHVEKLCTPEWRGRQMGQPGARSAANYIAAQFRALGLVALVPGYLHPFDTGGLAGINVLGILRGRGTAPRETIILEAHLDHVGEFGPGASDNAAGVACVIETARLLASGPRLRRDILFASFDGEEEGFLGANAYVQRPPVRLASTAAFIVLDAMGRPFADLPAWRLVAFGGDSSPQLETLVRRNQRVAKHLSLLSTEVIGPRSDYVPFAAARVPHLFFFNGTHIDYHNTGDTPEKLDYQRLAADGTLVAGMVKQLAAAPQRPAFRKLPGLPDDLPVLRGLWRELTPRWSSLPASLSAEVPALSKALASKPNRRQLMRAFDIIAAAATPWCGEMFVAEEYGDQLFNRGERHAAAAAYRKAANVVRAPVGRRYFNARAAELAGAGPAVTPPPSRPTNP